MENLWAPWRIDYILGPKPDACVFCLPEDSGEDAARLVLHRAAQCFVIMNKFPYNSGHLMVTPYRHVEDLVQCSSEECEEMVWLVRECVRICRQVFSPDGLNCGLNIGEAAGAGIREHLHFHVVPRWNGDSSFMAAFSETRVIPEHLHATFDKLKPHFEDLQR